MFCRKCAQQSWNIETSENPSTIEIHLARWHQTTILQTTQCISSTLMLNTSLKQEERKNKQTKTSIAKNKRKHNPPKIF